MAKTGTISTKTLKAFCRAPGFTEESYKLEKNARVIITTLVDVIEMLDGEGDIIIEGWED